MAKTSNPFNLKGLTMDQPARNTFDMGYKHVSHQPLGLMTPIYRQHILPSSYVDGFQKTFVTTQPLSTTLFTGIKHSTDYYFTPYRLLWKHWDNFALGINDDRSMLRTTDLFTYDSLASKVPFVSVYDLFKMISYCKSNDIKDIHGFPVWRNILRMLDLLGYSTASNQFFDPTNNAHISGEYDYNYWQTMSVQQGSLRMNILPLLAYQCNWWSFFRNNQYPSTITYTITSTVRTFRDRMPYWNIDYVGKTGDFIDAITKDHLGVSLTDSDVARRIFAALILFNPCYCPYYRDRLTSVQPSLILEDIISLDGQSGSDTHNSPVASNPVTAGNSSVESPWGNKVSGSSIETRLPTNLGQPLPVADRGISVTTLNLLYAREKLARSRAGNGLSYNQQHKAQWDTKKNFGCQSPVFIGSYNHEINATEVTSLSDTSVSEGQASGYDLGKPLGVRAGKIATAGQGRFKINCDEHGIILGLSYFQPENEYNSDIIDDFNFKINRHDFYHPAFDQLGLQPLYDAMFGMVKDNKSLTSLPWSIINGWQARYSEYKSRLSEIHGEFQSGRSLSNWCMPRSAVKIPHIASPANFYVNPSIGDTIFLYNFDSRQDLDHFMMNTRFEVKISQNMSELGVPSL